MKLPSPNSLQDNRGGGALMNLTLPNTLCEDGGGEGINVTSLYSPHSPRESFNYLNNEINSEDPSLILNKLRIKNERIIIGHLNINHIEKKFDPLVSLVKDRLDIFLLSETKIDKSFPPSQFTIESYSNPFRRDRNVHGGGLLLYVRDDIPCKEIKSHTLPNDIECLFIEIKLRNKKYIVMGGYDPDKDTISYFLTHVGKALDKLLCNYDDILLLGDFNSPHVEP